jgi:hypothetical protein
MQKEFVTYEIANKLKNLGFDEECIGCYCIDCGNESFIFSHKFRKNSLFKEHITAPLWQQAIDWLRVNHNINLGVYPCFVFENHYNYEIIIDRDFDNMLVSNNSNVLTYEKARELGILKAIELCKQDVKKMDVGQE